MRVQSIREIIAGCAGAVILFVVFMGLMQSIGQHDARSDYFYAITYVGEQG